MATVGQLYLTTLLLYGGPFGFAVGPFAVDPYDYYDYYDALNSQVAQPQEKRSDFFKYQPDPRDRQDKGGLVLSAEDQMEETPKAPPSSGPRNK